MKPDKSIERLEEDFVPYQDCPALLDATIASSFLDWLNTNGTDFYVKLADKQVRIGVLSRHIEARPNSQELASKLQDAGVQILPFEPNVDDDRLVSEIQRAYFGDNSKYRRSAQLLAYARRHNDESDNAQIISQMRIFRYIPSVQLYFVPTIAYRSIEEDDEALVYRRIVDALEIDSRVWDAAEGEMKIGNFRGALYEVSNAYFNELRRVSGETTDGRNLVEAALSNLNGRTPSILLNSAFSDLDPEINKNDQRGYYELACGVTAGVRNIVSHPKDEAFIRKRFGRQSTALKFLGLFSLLTERLPKK